MPPAVLILGLLIASPTLKAALLDGTMPADVALERVLIILIVTSLAWVALRALLEGYGEPAAPFPDLARLGDRLGGADGAKGAGAVSPPRAGAAGSLRAGVKEQGRRKDNTRGDRRASDR